MRYFIDAYNLIGTMTSIELSDPQKEEKLIRFFNNRYSLPNDRFMLIFDGNRLEWMGSQYQKGQCFCYFTPKGETADDYIIQKITNTSNRSSITVVSSDNAIIRVAKHKKVKMLRSQQFLSLPIKNIPTTPIKPAYTPSKEEVDYWEAQFNYKK